MTSDKAQKRAIRARMAKTGERFTAARLHLVPAAASSTLSEQEPELLSFAPSLRLSPSLPPRVAEPGMSDEAIQRGTGKTWDEWFVILDAWDATTKTHTEIARHLSDAHDVEGWWAQGVTVGYERARGMRAVNQRVDGYSVNASKTVPVPVERLYAALVDEDQRDRWIEPGTLRLRTAQPHRSARFDIIPTNSILAVNLIAKGPAKSAIQIEHPKLPTTEDREHWKPFWQERLERLATFLQAEDQDT